MTNALATKKFIDKAENLQDIMLNSNLPGIAKGNSDMFPLKHSFPLGLYIREMFMKEGGFVIGKVHKEDHVWFLLKGLLLVTTADGDEYYEAPCYVNAKAGCKRVIFALLDSTFVNVYPNPTNTQNIEELENTVMCTYYTTYEEYKFTKNEE